MSISPMVVVKKHLIGKKAVHWDSMASVNLLVEILLQICSGLQQS